MIILVATKNAGIHILDSTYAKSYTTFCNKAFVKITSNLVGIDSPIRGICSICERCANIDFQYYINVPRTAYNTNYLYDDFIVDAHQRNFMGPKIKFIDKFFRKWSKLSKIKSSIKRP